MSRAIHAILAAGLIALAARADHSLETPLNIRFQLADGVRIVGDLTAWNADGFEGSFGQRRWNDLSVNDIWSLHRRLMNAQSPEQWIDLGRVLLLCADRDARAASMAERAFRRALRLDASVMVNVETARREVAQIRRETSQRENAAAEARLRTLSPEAHPWPADPWPMLNDNEQAAATRTMKSQAEAVLRQAGVAAALLETDRVVLLTDVPRQQAARWAVLVEKTIDAAVQHLGDDENAHFRGIWGKLAVIIFAAQEDFRLAETASFRQFVPLNVEAICHSTGPRSFVVAWKCDDEAQLEWNLTRQVTLAVLHRWRTPRRLPAWANEGIAESVASAVLHDSPVAAERRERGLALLRTPSAAQHLLAATYADDSLSRDADAMAAAGAMVVELMRREDAAKFAAWFHAVKDGEEWTAALRREYRTTPENLARTAHQYYVVND